MSLRCRAHPIDAHRGSSQEFLERYEFAVQQAVHQQRDITEFLGAAVDRIADTRNLRSAWDHCRTRGGCARARMTSAIATYRPRICGPHCGRWARNPQWRVPAWTGP